MNNSIFSFLNPYVPTAALNARLMEDLFYKDSSSAISKARIFLEEIVSEIAKMEGLEDEFLNFTLYEKIAYLSRDGILDDSIKSSFDTIRISANKAVHEAEYNDIVQAFKVHKEVYNVGKWFYELYINKNDLIPPYENPKPVTNNNVDELIKHSIKEIFSKEVSNLFKGFNVPQSSDQEQNSVETNVSLPDDINTDADINNIQTYSTYENIEKPEVIAEEVIEQNQNPHEQQDLEKVNGSYLLGELLKLRISSAEAVENAQSFSSFKKYMHVERKIQTDLESILEQRKNNNSNLILLCGSVGDGKSHLLAYLNENRKELINGYIIFNDATESFSPSKTAMETLEEILVSFSDQKIESSNNKVIIAINLGVLHNFIYRDHEKYSYNALKAFVENSEIFTSKITSHFNENEFDLISFADYQPYEITENGASSHFFKSILKKVTQSTNDNPFYRAYKADIDQKAFNIVHENYEFLCDEKVQNQLVELVIKSMIQYKFSISSRQFINFISDIIIPNTLDEIGVMNDIEKINHTLPSLLFNRAERSELLNTISNLNPIHQRSDIIDELMVELNILTDWEDVIRKIVKNSRALNWFEPFNNRDEMLDTNINTLIEALISSAYLTNEDFASSIENDIYKQYLKFVYGFNTSNKLVVKEFYKNFKTVIFNWKGSLSKDYIYINTIKNKYLIGQNLPLHPKVDHLPQNREKELQSFKPFITVKYSKQDGSNHVYLDIDYTLYSLLFRVLEGYRPNKKDVEDSITFVEFLDKLMSFGMKEEELLINLVNERRKYKLQVDDFGSYVFERVTQHD